MIRKQEKVEQGKGDLKSTFMNMGRQETICKVNRIKFEQALAGRVDISSGVTEGRMSPAENRDSRNAQHSERTGH